MLRLRERLTFANVTASLALFIALGGTSYAAITLPRNSVGTNQLRTGAIRSVDVKDRSLEARDLSVAARRFLKGQKGAQGERGPVGPAGSAGQAGTTTGGGGGGTSALSLTHVTQPATVPAATGTGNSAVSGLAAESADCPAGRKVTGGGVRIDIGEDASVRESYPNVNNTVWTGKVGNDGDAPATFTVFAICAPAS